MEKLSRHSRKYLYEIAPYSDKPGYLTSRFRGSDYEKAKIEFELIHDLKNKGMISYTEVRDEISFVLKTPDSIPEPKTAEHKGHAGETKLPIPHIFSLTTDGRNYRKESRKQTFFWLGGILLTAILSGFFSWIFPIIIPR